MQQTEMLPQQSLQTIANWGMTFSSRPDEEKEFVQLYGKPLYDGALAVAQWWRSLSIGQIQAVNQIDFPYWTLTLARKLAKVPSTKLNNCLEALQKARLSVGKLSRILNKFIAPEKLRSGKAVTSDDWQLIARSFDLDGDEIDAIRQQAVQMNGGSTQSLTTDLVIEILTERGYPVAQILPKPRIKRYSRTEVEQLIAIKVQEAMLSKEQELLTLLERSRYLETENERLMTRLRMPSQCPTTVEVTPVTEDPTSQPDGFEKCLGWWEVSFSVGERVRIVDNTNNDDYGKTGIIKGQSKSDLALWWVQLSNGDYKQFPALVLESLPPSFDEERASMPISKQIVQKLKKIEQVPIAG